MTPIQRVAQVFGIVFVLVGVLGFVTTGFNKLSYWEAIRNVGRQFSGETRDFLTMHGINAATLREGKGCDKCRKTGYTGRSGLYELLVLDDFLRDQIARNPNVTEFRRTCTGRGMVTLREDGFKKIANGITTVEEVLSVTEGTI